MWKTTALFLFTLAVLVVCGLIVRPFIPAITGAVVLAVVTGRPHQWVRSRLPRPSLSAATSTVLVAASIIGPTLFLLQLLARQALMGADMIRQGRAQQGLEALLERFPQLAAAIERSSEVVALGDLAQNMAGYVSSHLIGALSVSLAVVFQLAVMLFILFFLYRDEASVVRFAVRLLPLNGQESEMLLSRLRETIRVAVLGEVLVSAAQGLLAGTVFALLGVRGAVVLGVLTAVAGLVPPLGAYMVWLPVAAWLAATGHWVKMAILLGTGSLLISSIDNILYPALVGTRLRQHTVTVLLSLLGGVGLFGLPGLVLGPLAFSAAEVLLNVWKTRGAEAPADSPL